MRSILIHAWTLHKINEEYFIPYTHWVYLNEIVKYYDTVWLLSPTSYDCKEGKRGSLETISCFKNVKVYEVSYAKNYIGSVKYFFQYLKAYKILSVNCDVVYARYPGPFGWLQKFYFKNKKRIIHYVGDPIDTIVNNPNLSTVKKWFYQLFFKPENFMFRRASREATVYTNGFHIATKLKKRKISSIPVISSTLRDGDFFSEEKIIDNDSPKFIYVGYLRKAKGVDVVLKAFSKIVKEKPSASLTIVGTGELEVQLQQMVLDDKIKNVVFCGHIDSRDKLNILLRESDIFCFGSVSEGSPRVVLEAMANGLVVVSTPVGSLPTTFKNEHEILFANFNDPNDFYLKMMSLLNNDVLFQMIRENSHEKVKQFTIEKFLKTIFDYE